MIYRGPGFLAAVWFLAPPSSPVRLLFRRDTGRLRKIDNFLKGEGEGGGRGAESRKQESWPPEIIQYSLLRPVPSPPPQPYLQ
jgi:hypothetical protein